MNLHGRLWSLKSMTKLLERALDELRKCSEHEQDAIAAMILEEIADDRRWDEIAAGMRPLPRLSSS